MKFETHLQDGYAWMETARRPRTTTAMRTECASFWCIFFFLWCVLLSLNFFSWIGCCWFCFITLAFFSGYRRWTNEWKKNEPNSKQTASENFHSSLKDRLVFSLEREDQVLRSTMETVTLFLFFFWFGRNLVTLRQSSCNPNRNPIKQVDCWTGGS